MIVKTVLGPSDVTRPVSYGAAVIMLNFLHLSQFPRLCREKRFLLSYPESDSVNYLYGPVVNEVHCLKMQKVGNGDVTHDRMKRSSFDT